MRGQWYSQVIAQAIAVSCVVVVSAVLALTLSGCSLQPSPPEEVVDLVMIRVSSWWFPLEVSNIQIKGAHPVEVVAADRANGIEEAWCVTVTLLINRRRWEHDEHWKWEDQEQAWLATKQHGQWIVEFREEGC